MLVGIYACIQQGTELLVFPELFLQGYDIGADRLRELARSLVSAK
jgi:predicted amidohydrolase